MAARDFVVIGLGRFGTSLCRTLMALGHDVLGIDSSMERVQEARLYVTDAVQVDATDQEALRSLGIQEYNAAVVAIGSDVQSSILVTLLLKELGVPRVLAKAGTAVQQRVLSKVGADTVILPEDDAGYRIAHSLVYPTINDFIDLGDDYMILEVHVLPEWVGKSLDELKLAGKGGGGPLRDYQGLQVMVIRRGHGLICTPEKTEHLQANDVLAVVGKHADLQGLV